MPDFYVVLTLVATLIVIVLGMFVLILDAHRATNRAFAFFSGSLAYWMFGDFIVRQSATLEFAQFWDKFLVFWPIVPISMMHFALVSTNRKIISKKWFLVVLYFPLPIISMVDLFTQELTLGIEMTPWGYNFVPNDSTITFYLSYAWAFLLCFVSLGLFLHYGLTAGEKSLRRASLFYVLALSLPTVSALINQVILPVISVKSLPLRSLSLFWIVVVMSWAIWKYNVFRPHQKAVARKILETMADPLLLLDDTLKIIYTNPAARNLFGLKASEQFYGQQFSTILDSEHQNSRAVIHNIEHHKSIKSFEIKVPVSEEIIQGLLSVGYVVGKRGKSQGIVCIIHDITERKKAERKLRRIQQDLVPSSRIAERAEVLSGLLHNIKNVLNSVGISLAMVDEKLKGSKIDGLKKTVALLSEHEGRLGQFFSEDPRGSKLLPYLSVLADRVESENDNVLHEISNLQKHFEHIKNVVEQRKSTAQSGLEAIDLSELIEDALLLKESDLVEHSIVVQREIDGGLVVQTDRHRILQVLVNLVTNALDAMKTVDNTKRKLTISSSISEESIKVAVRDNGQGIERENLENIFAFGFTTKEKGQGFGLHSCIQAVKEVGGTLEAQSDGKGHGATFTITLPRHREQAEQAEQNEQYEQGRQSIQAE